MPVAWQANLMWSSPEGVTVFSTKSECDSCARPPVDEYEAHHDVRSGSGLGIPHIVPRVRIFVATTFASYYLVISQVLLLLAMMMQLQLIRELHS